MVWLDPNPWWVVTGVGAALAILLTLAGRAGVAGTEVVELRHRLASKDDRLVKILEERDLARAELRRSEEVVAQHGSGFKGLWRFSLGESAGDSVNIGDVRLSYLRLQTIDGQTHAIFVIDTPDTQQMNWPPGMENDPVDRMVGLGSIAPAHIVVPIHQGESRVVRTQAADFRIVIEDDGYNTARAGISMHPGTYEEPGFVIDGEPE